MKELIDVFLDRAGAIGGVLGLIAAVFSAVAAARSADHARHITEQAAESERLAAWRQSSATARRVSWELAAAGTQLNTVARRWKSVFSFGGGTGNSRLRLKLDWVEEKKKEVDDLVERIGRLDLSQATFRSFDSSQLAQRQLELDEIEADAAAVREAASAELARAELEESRAVGRAGLGWGG